MSKKVEVHRSAKSGQFVTEKYTNTHPSTTVTERYAKPTTPPKKK